MAKAKIVTLAEEITSDLATQAWSLRFAPKRVYIPKLELEKTDQLEVQVAMAAIRVEIDNRTDWPKEIDIDVGVMFRAAKNAGDATEKFDECLKLLEEIEEHYQDARPMISDMPLMAIGYGGPSGSPYFPDHIDKFNQFTGVVRLTFGESL